MKKSQVLAALALAFALGVATIPSADTYAKITDEEGVTSGQKSEAYSQIKGLLAEVDKLENYGNYSALYNAFEGKSTGPSNGLIEKVNGWQKGWLLEEYNSGLTDGRNVNANIAKFNNILKNRAAEIKDAEKPEVQDKAHDNFRNIAAFSNASSVETAYAAVENVIKAVDLNLDIMRNNYTYEADNVIGEINNELAAIKSALTGGNAWTTRVNASAKNIFVSENGTTTYVNIANLANDVKAIDFNAYNQMTKDSAWTSTSKAGMTGMEMIRDLKLIIDTAKTLPKYNYVNAVATAVANVQLVQEDNPANVSYKNALNDIADLKTAIKAYRTGKAPSGTGDGNNNDDGDGDGEGNKAPDTGVLANAEGSASTTVAMVAGIATALTAAGAGVVAYRNARRSTRK